MTATSRILGLDMYCWGGWYAAPAGSGLRPVQTSRRPSSFGDSETRRLSAESDGPAPVQTHWQIWGRRRPALGADPDLGPL